MGTVRPQKLFKWRIEMTNQDGNTKDKLLEEIESDIKRYRKYRLIGSIFQWIVLLLVAIAGFFTTLTGAVDASGVANVWFANPNWLITWGLVTVIGSLVVQQGKPGQKAETWEKKKDAMRAIRTGLLFRGLELKKAAELMEAARSDPETAVDDLAGHLKA